MTCESVTASVVRVTGKPYIHVKYIYRALVWAGYCTNTIPIVHLATPLGGNVAAEAAGGPGSADCGEAGSEVSIK